MGKASPQRLILRLRYNVRKQKQTKEENPAAWYLPCSGYGAARRDFFIFHPALAARRDFFIPTPKKRLHFINKADKQHSVAVLAQLVEQRIRNAWVGGSSPLNGTIFLSAFSPPDNIFRHFLMFC